MSHGIQGRIINGNGLVTMFHAFVSTVVCFLFHDLVLIVQ